MTSDRPNIVLVVMDTARAKSFSCYGNSNQTTPFLDSLAGQNVKYENAISQANWTMPSHASIFSGEYNTEHDINGSHSFAEIQSFTEDLQDLGYHTTAVTNVTFLSEEFGADTLFDDFTYNAGPSFFSDIELDREEFHERPGYFKYGELAWHLFKNKRMDKAVDVLERKLRKISLRWDSGANETNKIVKSKIRSVPDDENFFLFLNYLEPHDPYLPPFPYSHKFLDNGFRWGSIISTSSENRKKYLDPDNTPPENLFSLSESLYHSELSYLDSKIEELYQWLKKEYPGTVFIFTADHGEYFYEHERVAHVVGLHSEVTHVPLIEVFPDGRTLDIESPVELRRLKDHIVELAKNKQDTVKSDRVAVSEYLGVNKSLLREKGVENEEALDKFSRYRASASTNEYRLIWFCDGEKVLYTLPEQEEVENNEKVEELSSIIVDRVGDPEEKSRFQEDEIDTKDEEIKQNLKDLGYM